MEERLNEYYVTNATNGEEIITIWKEGDCGTFIKQDFEQLVAAQTEAKVNFPSDGVYNVYLAGVLIGTAKYYSSLFNSAIAFVSASLCGSFASTCASQKSCTGETVDFLTNSYSKLMLYVANKATKYDEAVITATTKVRCSSKETWSDLLKQESITGVSDTTVLMQIQLGHLYMELYKVDKTNASPLQYEELDALYNYAKTIRCIQKLGIRDCDAIAVGGIIHQAEFAVSPIEIKLGQENLVTATFKFTEKDDTFISVIDTNVPNVSITDFDGSTHIVPIPAQTAAKEYYITYSYSRGGVINEKTVFMSTIAYPPQWYGAESTVADYSGAGGKVLVSTLKANITNVSPIYQSTSNGSSSNTGTSGKYIWWITANPVRVAVGGFEIPVGPWNDNCDPTSYAVIHKEIITVMEDGLTEIPMHYYRTCPLQELYTQTLAYTLNER